MTNGSRKNSVPFTCHGAIHHVSYLQNSNTLTPTATTVAHRLRAPVEEWESASAGLCGSNFRRVSEPETF